MKYYTCFTTEYSGFECDGHEIPHLVAANSEEEVFNMFDTRSDYDKENNSMEFDVAKNIKEFVLPDISRKKKTFEIV